MGTKQLLSNPWPPAPVLVAKVIQVEWMVWPDILFRCQIRAQIRFGWTTAIVTLSLRDVRFHAHTLSGWPITNQLASWPNYFSPLSTNSNTNIIRFCLAITKFMTFVLSSVVNATLKCIVITFLEINVTLMSNECIWC